MPDEAKNAKKAVSVNQGYRSVSDLHFGKHLGPH